MPVVTTLDPTEWSPDIVSSMYVDLQAAGRQWLEQRMDLEAQIDATTPYAFLRRPSVVEHTVKKGGLRLQRYTPGFRKLMEVADEATTLPKRRMTRSVRRRSGLYESAFFALEPSHIASIFLFVHPELRAVQNLKFVCKTFNKSADIVSCTPC
jgi:hypothetical protein